MIGKTDGWIMPRLWIVSNGHHGCMISLLTMIGSKEHVASSIDIDPYSQCNGWVNHSAVLCHGQNNDRRFIDRRRTHGWQVQLLSNTEAPAVYRINNSGPEHWSLRNTEQHLHCCGWWSTVSNILPHTSKVSSNPFEHHPSKTEGQLESSWENVMIHSIKRHAKIEHTEQGKLALIGSKQANWCHLQKAVCWMARKIGRLMLWHKILENHHPMIEDRHPSSMQQWCRQLRLSQVRTWSRLHALVRKSMINQTMSDADRTL